LHSSWAKMENILSSSKFNGKLVHFKLITLCVNRPLPILFVVYPGSSICGLIMIAGWATWSSSKIRMCRVKMKADKQEVIGCFRKM